GGSRKRRGFFQILQASGRADALLLSGRTLRGSLRRARSERLLKSLVRPLSAPAFLALASAHEGFQHPLLQILQSLASQRRLFGLLEKHASDLRWHIGRYRHAREQLFQFLLHVFAILAVAERIVELVVKVLVVVIDQFASLGAADRTRAEGLG